MKTDMVSVAAWILERKDNFKKCPYEYSLDAAKAVRALVAKPRRPPAHVRIFRFCFEANLFLDEHVRPEVCDG